MSDAATELLRTYNNNSLQQMVKIRGLTPAGKGKDAQVAALAAVLFDLDAITRSLADLGPNERFALDRLLLAGGEMPTAMLRGQLEREGRVEPEQKPERGSYYGSYGNRERGSARTRDSRRFPDLVARLGALGLVFTTEPIHGSGSIVDVAEPGRRLYVPEPIRRHLPPVGLPVVTMPAPGAVLEGEAGTLVRDLYSLLSFAARESIQLTARGGVAKRTIGRINQGLRRQEEITPIRVEEELGWLPFLRGLAEELGLLAASVGELVLDTRADDFLRLPVGERRQRLFAAYRQTGRWNELYRVPDLDVMGGKGIGLRAAPPGVITARQRILTEVAELPVGEWVAIDHLIDRLRTRAYEFLLSRRRSPHYFYYSSYYDTERLPNPYPGENDLGMTFAVYGEAEGWEVVEAGFIRVVTQEVLPVFGVVDLGLTGERPVALRVTADGASLLRGEALASDESRPNVVVQPNFQIFAFEPTGEDVLFTLDQLANRVRAEQAVEYELTRESIYRAQRAGFEIDRVIAFLESVSTVGVPQNVRRTLEEWGGDLERISLRRRAPLLQVDDPATLDALLVDPDLSPLLGRRLAPTVALVPTANLRPLADRLLADGRFPALTEGPDQPTAPAAPSLTVESDGTIAFRQRLPSIYDLHRLRPFAEEADGTFRLTTASLRRGARAGLSADEILTAIERFHAGPLSPEVAALVRRWAKDWGQGALFEAVVLQVDQAGTMADLLADPQVKALLDAVPGAPTLALVRPEGVERLRALLDARGMGLEDRLLR